MSNLIAQEYKRLEWTIIQYNRMMSYVERFAYDGRGSE